MVQPCWFINRFMGIKRQSLIICRRSAHIFFGNARIRYGLLAGILLANVLCLATVVSAYEVVLGLGSTAGEAATAAMGDRNKWPTVADRGWGILANYYPIALLPENQRAAVLANPNRKRAIVEIPYEDIAWSGGQGHISYIESYGYTTPYLLILNEAHQDSMMTRSELVRVKARFPDKTIVMNTRSWERDRIQVQSLADVLDGVCIEYIPTNIPYNINKHVSPFFEWAVKNNKVIMFLMPPQPTDYMGTRYIDGVMTAVKTIYNYNKNRLPFGWMASDKIFFIPANYTYGTSRIPYVPETGTNTILATMKKLMEMRKELDAIGNNSSSLPPMLQLLLN